MLFNGLLIFAIPHGEPHTSDDEAHSSTRITYLARQSKGLLGNEEECRADGSHKECGDEGDEKRLLVTHQIDGQRPQDEHGKSLIGPSEVLPDGVEAIRILHLPLKHRERAGKERNADVQALGDGALVPLEPFCHNETC